MKAIRYIAILILAAALAACGEKSEPYYTTSYPVSRSKPPSRSAQQQRQRPKTSPNRSRNPTLTLTLNLNLNPTR